MKVVEPHALLRAAADVLAPVMDDVIVIGASAVQVALADAEVVLTPTRDVDTGVADAAAGARVVAHLEAAGLQRSDLPHEHAFTWVSVAPQAGLKVQVVRPRAPFVDPPVRDLPMNNMLDEAIIYRQAVAFSDAPTEQRLWVAGPAALVGLKREAFGRTRPTDGALVERDYSDVVLLLGSCLSDIDASCPPGVMRRRCWRAATHIRDDATAREAAVRELVASGNFESEREAERAVRVITTRAADRLAP